MAARNGLRVWLARRRRAGVRLNLDEMTALLAAYEFTGDKANRRSLRNLHPHLDRAARQLEHGVAARQAAIKRAGQPLLG